MKSKRLIVAAVVLPVLISYIYFLPPFPYFLALLVGVGMLAMHEFYAMYRVPRKFCIPGVLTGGVLLYVLCRHTAYSVEAVFISLFILMFMRLIGERTPSGSMSVVGPLCVGFFYVAGFLSFQWFLRTDVFGLEYLFLLFASVWTADSTAYYVGTYTGRRKLYPAISPNKTVEGALGSIAGGSIGALIIKVGFSISDLTLRSCIFIGAILGTATVIGDLIESMFKRDAGVKDSGNLMPGHGGILDKVDGLLVAGPVLYLIVRYF